MISLLKRKERDTGIPADLVASIESADVIFRSSRGDDGEQRVLIRAVGLGAFYWQGISEAAERITHARELPPSTARKAAALLAQTVAHRNREMHAARPRRRLGSAWVRAAYDDIPEWQR